MHFQLNPTGKEINSYLVDGLTRFNQKTLGLAQRFSTPICFEMTENGKRVGGIEAYYYLEYALYISFLFIEEEYRHNGIGLRLLRAVEEEGKKLGAKLAHVDTFDFQAKDFYLKQGYEVYGVLNECPPGHARYYFRKIL